MKHVFSLSKNERRVVVVIVLALVVGAFVRKQRDVGEVPVSNFRAAASPHVLPTPHEPDEQ